MESEKDLRLMLAQILGMLGEDRRMRAAVESRIALIHEQVRQQGETLVRLKLMAENARRQAFEQNEALQRIGYWLDGKEGRS
ncbi:MAG: hypothetical protein AB7P23_08750 [Amphiplicatus sp.]